MSIGYKEEAYGEAGTNLIGKTVSKIELEQGSKTLVVFHCEDGFHVSYFTDGDCCSSSWIEHMEGVKDLLGGEVVSAEQIDLGSFEDSEERSIKLYAFKLHLKDRQPFVMEFRNASNGYYGGSLECNDERLCIDPQVITEDF